MIVLDASAVVELLLNTDRGVLVAECVRPDDVTLHAPQLLPLEVVQVLRRLTSSGSISARRGRTVLDDLGELGVEYYDHDVLVPRLWQLRSNLTAYDAAYVALAEALAAPLLTFDERLANAPGNRAHVELLA